MYRTSIQLYIFPHMVTEPQYRDTVIQRDTARYSDTAIQRDTPIHMYHHPSARRGRSPLVDVEHTVVERHEPRLEDVQAHCPLFADAVVHARHLVERLHVLYSVLPYSPSSSSCRVTRS